MMNRLFHIIVSQVRLNWLPVLLYAIVAGLASGGLLLANEQSEELLKNPGFDEDADHKGMPDGWKIGRDAALWTEKSYLSGDYVLVSKPGAYGLATQPIRLKPGQRYTLTLTLKGEDGALGGALILHGPEKPNREMPLLWEIQPTSNYEQYVTTFIAPDPVAVLYVYNVSKKGTIYYDRVSLREGEPSSPIIGQLSLKEIDQPRGDWPGTPHIDWASPLAGGAIKTFIALRSLRSLHDVPELAQRIDLDYDAVETGERGDQCVCPTGRRAMKRLAGAEYQVYVVSSRTTDAMVKSICQNVAAGAGLVVLEGFAQGSRFLPAREWKTVDKDHPLLAGIPWNLMPEKLLQSVQVGSIGKGRMVRLLVAGSAGRVWGLLPVENSLAAYRSRQCEYWEWWHAFLARSIQWAAGREYTARLAAEIASPDTITIRAAGAPSECRARVIVRSGREIRFDGPLWRTAPQQLDLSPDGSCHVDVPAEFPAGPLIADIVLLNRKGEALTWASVGLQRPQQVRLVDLKTDHAFYAPDVPVRLQAMLASPQPVDATIEARLIDAFGRVVSETRQAQRLIAGEQELGLSLPLRSPLCVFHRAVVRVIVASREQDSRWVPVSVPAMGPRMAADDFLVMPWSPSATHPAIFAQYAARLRELGINGAFAAEPYLLDEQGMPGADYIGADGAFYTASKSPDGVRPKCPSDPQVIQAYTAMARQRATEQLPHGLFGVGITDEACLTSRQQRDEVCFCRCCQDRYRGWLQKQYGSLATLNAHWETSYKDWDEIQGARTEEVRGRENFAPFVDFRTFMTDVWVDACKSITAAYHEVAPHTPVGHTNTFGAEPFNGNDYWKLATRTGFGWGQEYSEAIKPQAQKAIFEVWHSFVETPEARASRSCDRESSLFFDYGWIGYHHSVEAAHYEPWWLALHGARGTSWFAANIVDPVGTSYALVFPDLSYTNYSMAVRDSLADLRAGCGKLLMEYQREEPQVALLWSYPSMLVSWCESTWDTPEPNDQPGADSYGSYFRSALNFRRHVEELQLDCKYLAPEQILASDVLKQCPVLFLPFTVAIEEQLVEKLDAYVSAGGILVADLRALRTDAHGEPFVANSPLGRLFGVERGAGKADYRATKIRFTSAGGGLDLARREWKAYGREKLAPAGASALAVHATGEPAILVRPHGQGLALYLNFLLPDYDVATRELLRQVFARAGISRTVIAENPHSDAPPRCYDRNSFRRGSITVHGFIRDWRRSSDCDPVRFHFDKESHVYDMRARKYLGWANAVETTLAPGEAALYACLPYRIDGLELSVPHEVAAGGAMKIHARVRVADVPAGDHVFHVQLLSPTGQAVWHYTSNQLAPAGTMDLAIPLAHNEAAGTWTVGVHDVLSGTEAEATFLVMPHPAVADR
jgi:hypothetical protein